MLQSVAGRTRPLAAFVERVSGQGDRELCEALARPMNFRGAGATNEKA